MMKPTLVILCTLFLNLFAVMPQAQAEQLFNSDWLALRGFGTVGISCFTGDEYDYIREERPNGPGKSRRCDAEMDSTLGLQVDANLTDSLQATVQGTGYHRADDTFTPELTLANLRWEFDDDLYLRVGRMQTPMFFSSEYRNVLYAQPWIRPPVELYNLTPAYAIDGIELSHRRSLAGWDLDIRGGASYSNLETSWADGTNNTYDAKVKFGYLDVRLGYENWLFKASLLGGTATFHQPNVDYLLSLLNRNLATDLAIDDKQLLLFGFGTRYETNLWLVQTEYLYRNVDSFFRDQHAAYLLVGRRLRAWMPYTIFAGRWSVSQHKENKASPAEYALAKEIVDFTFQDRESIALGLSRKLGEQAIIKLQCDWVAPDGSKGHPDDIEHLVSLNLDFVF